MPYDDIQQITVALIEYAQANKNMRFNYIRTLNEYYNYKDAKELLESILDRIDSILNKLIKSYCRSVVRGNADILQLLTYQQLLQVITFYKKEISVISDMICEYRMYLLRGHYIRSCLGEYRPQQDLKDFRKFKGTLNGK